MKTLQKQVAIVWRFRCDRCRSQFEMTDAEKVENDKKFDESHIKGDHIPHNPMEHFDCPVCGKVEYVRRGEMHKFMLMEDGSEFQEY